MKQKKFLNNLKMEFDVIVMGGGATGTAVLRDLTMRGLEVAFIERGKIAMGTTSSSHHNLVGGMRYVMKDPIVAQECALENEIISRTAPSIVRSNRNYFVGFRNEYTDRALKQAGKLGIYYKEVDVQQAFREIPELNRSIDIVIETADRNIDVERFCVLNYKVGERNKGRLLEHTQVHKIEKDKNGYNIETNNGKLQAEVLVNATGVWVNSVAQKLGVKIPILYSQGTIIVQKTLSPRGLQYFHEPSDADAYIVHDGQGWLGTTSTSIRSPDDARPEEWAEEYLKERFSVILPEIMAQETINQFSGVRPLIKNGMRNGREVSRSFQIIEKPENVYHVVGGKLTLARLMAEKVSDLVCDKLNKGSECRTMEEMLEGEVE